MLIVHMVGCIGEAWLLISLICVNISERLLQDAPIGIREVFFSTRPMRSGLGCGEREYRGWADGYLNSSRWNHHDAQLVRQGDSSCLRGAGFHGVIRLCPSAET